MRIRFLVFPDFIKTSNCWNSTEVSDLLNLWLEVWLHIEIHSSLQRKTPSFLILASDSFAAASQSARKKIYLPPDKLDSCVKQLKAMFIYWPIMFIVQQAIMAINCFTQLPNLSGGGEIWFLRGLKRFNKTI